MTVKMALGFLGQAFKSGKAMGTEVKVTQIAEALAKNPKTVGEQIGHLLGGKGQEVLKGFGKTGGFEVISTKINELAQMYPEAAVKIGVKQSNKGFTVVKASVKNGEKEIINQAISYAKDGTVKTRGKIGKTVTHSYSDIKGNLRATAERGTVKTTITRNIDGLSGKVTESGEEVLAVQAKFGTHAAGTKAGYESADGLSYFNFGKDGIEFSGIYDEAKTAQLIKQDMQETKEQLRKVISALLSKRGGGKPSELVLQILRPLRERFNTAVDLYKYNGIKDFERFLSYSELKSELVKIVGEEKSISEKVAKALKTDNISINTLKLSECPKDVQEKFAYIEQIKSDINNASELIRLYC